MPLSLFPLWKVGWSDLLGGGRSLLAGGCVHKVGENLCLVEKKFKSLSLVLCLWGEEKEEGEGERRRKKEEGEGGRREGRGRRGGEGEGRKEEGGEGGEGRRVTRECNRKWKGEDSRKKEKEGFGCALNRIDHPVTCSLVSWHSLEVADSSAG